MTSSDETLLDPERLRALDHVVGANLEGAHEGRGLRISSSDSESDPPPAAAKPKPTPAAAAAASDDSSSDDDSDSETEGGAAAVQTGTPIPPASAPLSAPKSAPAGARGQGVPFQRVDVAEWTGKLAGIGADNSYKGTFGEGGYGAKAQEKLGVTRGKGFTKEKNKAKRGSYRGGLIDANQTASIKFDSD